MKYYLILFSGKPMPLNCVECYVKTHVENPDSGREILGLYHEQGYIIHEFYTNPNSKLKSRSDYRATLDRINDIGNCCPNIDEILEALSIHDITDPEKIHVLNFKNILGDVLQRAFSDEPFNDKISFAEINIDNPEIVHYQQNSSAHIYDKGYEIIQIWNFDRSFIDFIKHLVDQGVNIIPYSLRLMKIAIYNSHIEMINELVALGVNINCGDSRSYGLRNCAVEAVKIGGDVLRHVLDLGCKYVIDALLMCIQMSNRESAQIVLSYCDIDTISPENKATLASNLIFYCTTIELFEDFQKAGLIITNEIMSKITKDECMSVRYHIIEYLLSIGIDIVHFHYAYTSACITGNLRLLELLEKAGIFEHFKPVDFLISAMYSSPLVVQRLLDFGIDAESNQDILCQVFVEMCANHSDRILILEPYIELQDHSLLNDALMHLVSTNRNHSYYKTIEGFNYLLQKGAIPSNLFIMLAAANDMLLFEHILDLELEFDVDLSLKEEDLPRVDNLISIILSRMIKAYQKLSLIEIVIFSKRFEKAFIELIKRGVKLDTNRLILMFNNALNDSQGAYPNAKSRVEYLVKNKYLDVEISN